MSPLRWIIPLLLVLVVSTGLPLARGSTRDSAQTQSLVDELQLIGSRIESGASSEILVEARKRLTDLRDKLPAPGYRDLEPAIHRLLGDTYLLQDRPDPNEAWIHYGKALDYWARDRRLPVAAEQYGAIIEHAARIAGEEMGIHLPVWALENLLEISHKQERLVLAHYFLGRHLAEDDSAAQKARAGAEFALALADAAGSSWHDDILFHYAKWAAANGYSTYDDQGQILLEPDFERALELYDQLFSNPDLADSPYIRTARAAVEQISEGSLNVAVAHVFRPNTQIQFLVNWRNLQQVEISLHPVDLTEAVKLTDTASVDEWLQTLSAKSEPVRRLTLTQQPARPHYEVSHLVRIDEALPHGAYLVHAKSGEQVARDVVIVSDHALVLKVTDTQVLAYVGAATNGAPAAEAPVSIWIKATGKWTHYKRVAGADGIVMTTLPEGGVEEVAAFSNVAGSQSFAMFKKDTRNGSEGSLQIYPYTSRQSYNSGETVRWAIIGRVQSSSKWAPPQEKELNWKIVGPDGVLVFQETTILSSYGSSNGYFTLPAKLPIGVYFAEFDEAAHAKRYPLFIVEEDFSSDIGLTVSLAPGQSGGGYSTGETIRGTLYTNYAFGGPLPNTEVELSIREQPFDASKDGLDGSPTGSWRELAKQTLKTDTRGQASFTLQTSPSTNSDFIYTLSFRARDNNGRPAVESVTIRATRQTAYAYVESQKQLYLPNQSVQVNVLYQTDQGQPLAQQGQLRILRESWREVWVDRRGREIGGEELRQLKRSSGGWFSFGPAPSDYRLKSEGYQTEEVLSTTLECNERGQAEFVWDKAQPGFYRVQWVAGSSGGVIRGEDSFWVCGPESADIGYRAEKIQLLSNELIHNPGDTAPVMIVTPSPDRYVLVTTGTDKIDSWKLIHLAETARLTNVSLGKHHAPALAIQATAISESGISTSEEKVRVKAIDHALQIHTSGIDGTPKPGEEVTLVVTVKDAHGDAVSGALVMLTVAGRSTVELLQSPSSDATFSNTLLPRMGTASGIQLKPFFRPLDPTRNVDSTSLVDGSAGSTTAQLRPDSALTAGATESKTVTWQPNLITDENGRVHATFTLPRQTDEFRCIIRAMDQVGAIAERKITLSTRQAISSSYVLPRHAYEGDTIGNLITLTNETPELRSARILIGGPEEQKVRELTLEPNKKAMAAWSSPIYAAGEISLPVSVAYGDVMDELLESVTIKPAPRLQFGGASVGPSPRFNIVLPALPEGATPDVIVSATPSLAAIALEELQTLLDLSHSSTGEIASRFAGPALLLNTLYQLSFDSETIKAASNRDIPSETRFSIDHGIAALAYSQQENGSWGWFNSGTQDPSLSAYILTLLYLTSGDGIEVPAVMLERGQVFLAQRLIDDTDSDDVQAWILQALAHRFLLEPGRPTRLEARAMINLIREQERLSSFGLASLVLAAHLYGLEDESHSLLASLVKRAKRTGSSTRYWQGLTIEGGNRISEIETTALALCAKGRITELDPADRATLHWLISEAMENTSLLSYRERTALALALRSFLQRTGDFDAVGDAEIWANETYIGTTRVSVSNPLTTQWKWAVPHSALKAQQNTIEIRPIKGEGPWVAMATVSLPPEARIDRSASALALSRQFVRTKLAPTLLNGYVEESDVIEDEGRINPGDRVEVVLRVESEAPVRHLVIEDYRPGCLEISRGGIDGLIVATDTSDPKRTMAVISESTEDSTTFFIELLPPGTWELRYQLRARALGTYLAPPAVAYPMEKPRIRALTDSVELKCWNE